MKKIHSNAMAGIFAEYLILLQFVSDRLVLVDRFYHNPYILVVESFSLDFLPFWKLL